jgi:hypothetical protein
MSEKKYSFGQASKMKALEPGQEASLKFLGEPKIVDTEWGPKFSIPIHLYQHPSYPSLSPDGMEVVWQTNASVVKYDLVILLKESKEFQKDYLKRYWTLRVDDGGSYRLEG